MFYSFQAPRDPKTTFPLASAFRAAQETRWRVGSLPRVVGGKRGHGRPEIETFEVRGRLHPRKGFVTLRLELPLTRSTNSCTKTAEVMECATLRTVRRTFFTMTLTFILQTDTATHTQTTINRQTQRQACIQTHIHADTDTR